MKGAARRPDFGGLPCFAELCEDCEVLARLGTFFGEDDDGYSRITVEVSPQVRKAIEEMLGAGLFGLSLAGVVEEMIRAGARDAIRKGWARPPRGLVVRDGELVLEDVTKRRKR